MNSPIDETHDPSRTSWIESANTHPDFPVQNLPFGIFSPPRGGPRIGVAIGNKIVDLKALQEVGLLGEQVIPALAETTLNALFSAPAGVRLALRRRLSALLSDSMYRTAIESLLLDTALCTLHLPASIGDYTDFYVGIHHAKNVGQLFRPDNPLLPNYKYVPIGYHGRASSVQVSGRPVVRPKGQSKAPNADTPSFGPSRRLDYELELGIWVGCGNQLGVPIDIADAPGHIAGFCLLNDWSARDVQAWEYQPLGPFMAKNFHTTVSPWVVTIEALAPFRIQQPPRPPYDPKPLDYLWNDNDQRNGAFAIELDVFLTSARMREAGLGAHRLSQGSASNMYWTAAQIVTHHTSNGCNLNPGDLLGTGTISGPDPGGYGSLLEITKNGSEHMALPTGETRGFLEDGDEICFTAVARTQGRVPIGFGTCRATVLPAQ